jgi:hypothetical protein
LLYGFYLKNLAIVQVTRCVLAAGFAEIVILRGDLLACLAAQTNKPNPRSAMLQLLIESPACVLRPADAVPYHSGLVVGLYNLHHTHKYYPVLLHNARKPVFAVQQVQKLLQNEHIPSRLCSFLSHDDLPADTQPGVAVVNSESLAEQLHAAGYTVIAFGAPHLRWAPFHAEDWWVVLQLVDAIASHSQAQLLAPVSLTR